MQRTKRRRVSASVQPIRPRHTLAAWLQQGWFLNTILCLVGPEVLANPVCRWWSQMFTRAARQRYDQALRRLPEAERTQLCSAVRNWQVDGPDNTNWRAVTADGHLWCFSDRLRRQIDAVLSKSQPTDSALTNVIVPMARVVRDVWAYTTATVASQSLEGLDLVFSVGNALGGPADHFMVGGDQCGELPSHLKPNVYAVEPVAVRLQRDYGVKDAAWLRELFCRPGTGGFQDTKANQWGFWVPRNELRTVACDHCADNSDYEDNDDCPQCGDGEQEGWTWRVGPRLLAAPALVDLVQKMRAFLPWPRVVRLLQPLLQVT